MKSQIKIKSAQWMALFATVTLFASACDSPSNPGTAVPPQGSTPLSPTLPGSLYGSRNETLSKIFTAPAGASCATFSDSTSQNFTIRHYKMIGISTQHPSAQGISPGTYYDALVPGVTKMCAGDLILADIAIHANTPPGNYNLTVAGQTETVRVWKSTLPTRPTLPFYSEITTYALLPAHHLSLDSNVSVLGPLTALYVNELRAHRIEPLRQSVSIPAASPDGSLNIDQYSSSSASYRQLVLDGAIAPVMVATYFGSSPSNRPSPSYLQGVERMIQDQGLTGAWTYIWDEPTASNYPEIQARAALVRQYAPSLKIMVTNEPTSAIDADIFFPIFETFNRSSTAHSMGVYGSCVSHGSCVNSSTGKLTGTPDLMLDVDPTNWIAYPMVAYVSGAKYGLYYDTTYDFGVSDPWTDSYQFGGNGDGNLFYPGLPGMYGLSSNTPVASYRMKMIRYGQNLIDYIAMSGKNQNVVLDAFHWSHAMSDYENLRLAIGTQLDAQ